jgi:hypothetical protein
LFCLFGNNCTINSSNWVIFRLPNLLVKLIVRSGWLRGLILEVLSDLIDAHLSNTLALAAADINAAFLGLLFTSDEDIVPLIELRISDFFVELGV